MGGYIPPPHFFGWGGGSPVQISPPPPLFEDKITLNLTFIVKKLTFLTVKLYQILQKSLARSQTMYSDKAVRRNFFVGGQDYLQSRENASEGAKRPSGGRGSPPSHTRELLHF